MTGTFFLFVVYFNLVEDLKYLIESYLTEWSFQGDLSNFMSEIGFLMILLSSFAVIGAYCDRILGFPSERAISDRLEATWIGLWHPDDEVIQGLKASIKADANIVASRSFSGLLLSIFYLLTVGLTLSLIVSPLAFHFEWITKEQLIFILSMFPLCMLFVAIIVGICAWRPAIPNFVVYRPLNRFFIRQVGLKAQGQDIFGYGSLRTTSAPIDLDDHTREYATSHLGREIASEITNDANKNAPLAMSSIRTIVGLAAATGGNLVGLEISDSDKKNLDRALIHSSYFSNERVIKLIAYAITKISKRSHSLEMSNDPDFERLEEWLVEIKKNSIQ